MTCHLCGENHIGHCSRMVKQLRAELNAMKVESLTKSNASPKESNKTLTFDKTAYQREYMRKRRAK